MTKKSKLLIIGASGHGRVVAEIAMKMNKWHQIAFLDDNDDIESPLLIDVIGKSYDSFALACDYDIFVAIGNNKTREKLQKDLIEAGAIIPTLTHPNAIIGEKVELGIGTVVMAGAVINCCSSIGEGCIVNTGVIIEHDNTIDDYVHISPGAHLAGTVKVGRGSWLGIGSVISNNISITSGCTIGAGTVVIKDLTEPGIYVGVPAKKIELTKRVITE